MIERFGQTIGHFAEVVVRARSRVRMGVCETALRASFFLTAVAVAGAAASADLPPSIVSDLDELESDSVVGEFSSSRLVDSMPRDGVAKKLLILFLAFLRRSVGVCGSATGSLSLLLCNATSWSERPDGESLVSRLARLAGGRAPSESVLHNKAFCDMPL